MNKIIILKNNNGRLANQLWLYASVYAYCLEKEYECENPSFFRYNHYFNTSIPKNFSKLFFNKDCFYKSRLLRKSYLLYTVVIMFFNKKRVIQCDSTFILPPDISDDTKQQEYLRTIESGKDGTFYFCGWLFRTPTGVEKHGAEIRKYFKPKEKYLDNIKKLLSPLREAGKYIVGVHIRHGDYKTWNGGAFFYSFEEVRQILESYLAVHSEPKRVVFVLCSDDKINNSTFTGLPYISGLGSEIEDLYTLSQTDIIIGSNSSFGAWSAYFGDIPFIRFPDKTQSK